MFRDYATVDETVFSPSRAKLCRTVTSRASPRLVCCRYKHLDDARVGRGHVTLQQWRHAFQQWRNNWSVSRASDQGFIGETEARLQALLDGRLQEF
jgi:hypothetical protein